MNKTEKKNITISYLCIVATLIVSCILCIFVGSAKVSISDLFVSDSIGRSIIFEIRIPRMIAAIFAGGALAVSGYCLQTFFHNPIAGPYLLGISSGAKLAVAIIMIIFAGRVSVLSSFSMILSAFVGALISMSFVLLISKYVGNMSMLLVCGVMIGYICTAVCDLLIAFADDSDIVNLHNWSRGSLSGIMLSQALVMAVVVIVCFALSLIIAKPMSAFLVSENYAKSVGVNIRFLRAFLVILSSLLSATVTAFAGPISFVGIAVPHLVKKIVKSSKPICVIPACFLSGAVFTCICDLIARTLFAPTELSISTVTAVFGSPVVIYMLINRNRK